jgi:hypothetical protein
LVCSSSSEYKISSARSEVPLSATVCLALLGPFLDHCEGQIQQHPLENLTMLSLNFILPARFSFLQRIRSELVGSMMNH